MMLSRVACPAILRCDAVTWSPGECAPAAPARAARARARSIAGARARAATSILSDS